MDKSHLSAGLIREIYSAFRERISIISHLATYIHIPRKNWTLLDIIVTHAVWKDAALMSVAKRALLYSILQMEG